VKYLETVAAIALVAVIFWPWAAGALDVASWVAVGHAVTGIPWAEGRGAVAICWPIAWAFFIGLAVNVFS